MLIKLTTDKSIDEISKDLETATLANQFGLMHIHDLKATMIKKGVDFDNECLIFEICQPHQAKKVLEHNINISTALPCRISVFKDDGKTVLATIKPTVLLEMFDSTQLQEVAEEVEKTIIKIMNDAISK